MIIINNISKSIGGKELFRSLSLTLNRDDRLAIVGQNGCGKSTLLRILAGFEEQDEGVITSTQEQIYLAPQHIDASANTTINGYLDVTEHPEVWRLLSELNLLDLPLDTAIGTLSGGQKTKLLLAKTFICPSTTLLLDEPTNHLDVSTRQWLLQQILDYRGIIVIISHDRAFLNKCATHILEIDPVNHRTMLFHGNYDRYKNEKKLWIEQQHDEYERQQKKKREMLEWLTLKRQEATAHPNAAKGRQIRQMEHRLDREILSQEVAKQKKTKDMANALFAGSVHNGKLMLRISHLTKAYEGHEVLRDISFELRGSVHARLTGDNGSGKSTLLRTIIGELTADSGSVEIGDNVRIGYFAQQLETLDKTRNIIQAFLNATNGFSESHARAVLGAFLFTGDHINTKIGNLSYGERVRLQLAIILQQEYQLLILDEPTNHLDIPSRESIEQALTVYKGTLLVVSHDEYFLKNIGIDVELSLRDGMCFINT